MKIIVYYGLTSMLKMKYPVVVFIILSNVIQLMKLGDLQL